MDFKVQWLREAGTDLLCGCRVLLTQNDVTVTIAHTTCMCDDDQAKVAAIALQKAADWLRSGPVDLQRIDGSRHAAREPLAG